MLLLGQLRAGERKYPEAELAFNAAVQLDPQSVEVRGIYGGYRVRRHQYEEALKQLDPALAKDPTNPELLDPAVRAMLAVGRNLDAAKKMTDALRKYPADPQLLFLDAKVSEQFGRAEESFKGYEKVLAKKPDHAEALVALGFGLLAKGDADGAKAKLEAAIAAPGAAKSPLVQSVIGDLCFASISGRGPDGYRQALAQLRRHLDEGAA